MNKYKKMGIKMMLASAPVLASLPLQYRDLTQNYPLANEVIGLETKLGNVNSKYFSIQNLSRAEPSMVDSLANQYKRDLVRKVEDYGVIVSKRDSLKSLPDGESQYNSYKDRIGLGIASGVLGLGLFFTGITTFYAGIGIDRNRGEKKK